MGEAFDLDAVDALHDAVAVAAQTRVDFIGQHAGEHDEVFAGIFFALVEEIVDGGDDVGQRDAVGFDLIERDGLEDEAAVADVAGLLVEARCAEFFIRQGDELGGLLHFLALADDVKGDGVAHEGALGEFFEAEALSLELDHTRAIDGLAVDGGDDVAEFEDSVGAAALDDASDDDSESVISEAVVATHARVLRLEEVGAQRDVLVVAAVFDVFEEALDDGGGDDVAGAVRLQEALEGDADDFVTEEDGTAAVARVDGGVDLDGEVRAVACVAVDGVLDA